LCAAPVTAKGKTFLVIDTDEKHLREVSRFLKHDGAELVHVASALAFGLDILRTARPGIDCIICAEDLSPATGIELLKGLRTGRFGDSPHMRGVKFLMVTAHREAALVIAGKQLDVDGFLLKPIDANSFRRHLHQALAHDAVLQPPEHYLAVDIRKAVRLPVLLRDT
jgi:DNA-binding NarL/FixJ family response regulator